MSQASASQGGRGGGAGRVAADEANNADIVTSIDNTVAGPKGIGTSYALFTEQQLNGVNSTLDTSNAGQNYWRRILNTLVEVEDSIATLNADGKSVDVIAGKYRFRGVHIIQTNENTTNSIPKTFLTLGDPLSSPIIKTGLVNFHKAGGTANSDAGYSIITGIFEVTETTQISLAFFNNTINFIGGTAASNDADDDADDEIDIDGTQPEIYATLELWREGGDITTTVEITAVVDPRNPLARPPRCPVLPVPIFNPVPRLQLAGRRVTDAHLIPEDDYQGVNTRIVPERLNRRETPNSINIDSIGHSGSLVMRRGIARMVLKGASHDEGISIGDLKLIQGADLTANMLAVGKIASALNLATLQQTIAPPPAFAPKAAPLVTLTDAGGGDFNVAIPINKKFSGVEKVLIKWDDTDFPISIFEEAERKSANLELKDWFGDTVFSEDITPTPFSTPDIFFVTVWVLSPLGFSRPFKGKVSVA